MIRDNDLGKLGFLGRYYIFPSDIRTLEVEVVKTGDKMLNGFGGKSLIDREGWGYHQEFVEAAYLVGERDLWRHLVGFRETGHCQGRYS